MIPDHLRKKIMQCYRDHQEKNGCAPNLIILTEDDSYELCCSEMKPRRLFHGLDYGSELQNVTGQSQLLLWCRFANMEIYSIPVDTISL